MECCSQCIIYAVQLSGIKQTSWVSPNACDIWVCILWRYIMERVVHLFEYTVRCRLVPSVSSPPWMNYSIHYFQCNCQSVERLWKSTKLPVHCLYDQYLVAKFNNMIKLAKSSTQRTGSLFSNARRNPGVIFGTRCVINICIFLYINPYWTFTLYITSMWARTTGLLLHLKSSSLDLSLTLLKLPQFLWLYDVMSVLFFVL